MFTEKEVGRFIHYRKGIFFNTPKLNKRGLSSAKSITRLNMKKTVLCFKTKWRCMRPRAHPGPPPFNKLIQQGWNPG